MSTLSQPMVIPNHPSQLVPGPDTFGTPLPFLLRHRTHQTEVVSDPPSSRTVSCHRFCPLPLFFRPMPSQLIPGSASVGTPPPIPAGFCHWGTDYTSQNGPRPHKPEPLQSLLAQIHSTHQLKEHRLYKESTPAKNRPSWNKGTEATKT